MSTCDCERERRIRNSDRLFFATMTGAGVALALLARLIGRELAK